MIASLMVVLLLYIQLLHLIGCMKALCFLLFQVIKIITKVQLIPSNRVPSGSMHLSTELVLDSMSVHYIDLFSKSKCSLIKPSNI